METSNANWNLDNALAVNATQNANQCAQLMPEQARTASKQGTREREREREKEIEKRGKGWPTTRSLICITGRAVDGFARIQRKGGEREREREGRKVPKAAAVDSLSSDSITSGNEFLIQAN